MAEQRATEQKAPERQPSAVERAEQRLRERQQAVADIQAGGAAPPKPPEGALFEVMAETWGAEPQLVRGDLIRQADVPHYDLAWAEQVGAIRQAPEYDTEGRSHLTTTTQPVDQQGRIDTSATDAARGESGGQPPKAANQKGSE